MPKISLCPCRRCSTIVFSMLVGCAVIGAITPVRAVDSDATFCNPLDLDYRFQLDQPSRREAADPTMVLFDNEYWLFASKSGGYWHSTNFQNWVFVDGKNLPIEDYAPAVVIIHHQLYYTAFNTHAIYRADDPRLGTWTKVGELKGYPDPDLFCDDDGRVYVYYGCSPNGGIDVAELDPANDFKVIGEPKVCFKCDPPHRGWEVPGEENVGDANGKIGDSWIEGAWMTKHDGKYYLQYSAPGTQYHSYADGVFVGDSPTGPFTYAPYSPFSHKPTGFATGAGHSSTFQDQAGNWWHIATITISKRHMFERRLGVYPAGFCADGQMFCNTYLGDYPQFLPGEKSNPTENNSPGWMLLSYAKTAEASSTLPGFAVSNAFDEDIRTWWSAATGNAGEWLKVDLGNICQIHALQINFADEGANALGKLHDDAYQYYVEASPDGKAWAKIVDRDDNRRDAPHDYAPLPHPVKARYVRLVNVHFPAGAKFSVSGLRIFGHGPGHLPEAVEQVAVQRNPGDPRKATVTWAPGLGAEFYIVRYGLAPDRLFENYQIYGATSAVLNALNDGVDYYFTVDAVNSTGIKRTKSMSFTGSTAR